MPFKNLIKAVFLGFTFVALAATSMAPKHFVDGSFQIKSDCSGALQSEQISVSSGRITTPTALKYTDFGFPSDTVLYTPIIGTVAGKNRECRITYGNRNSDKAKNILYSCFDDGVFVCSIAMSL